MFSSRKLTSGLSYAELNTGRAACIVSVALYRLSDDTSLRLSRKLQTIFSLAWKLSLVHLRVLRKLLSAFCSVANTFLSICELIRLALTVILACSSCAVRAPGSRGMSRNKKSLRMEHLYNGINDIGGNLLLCLLFVYPLV